MLRRIMLTMLFATAAALPAVASDDSCPAGLPPRVEDRFVHIERLFAVTAAAAAERETESGSTPELPSLEVVVARVGADGKILLGCVDSAEAAKRFLEAPEERIAKKEAAEK